MSSYPSAIYAPRTKENKAGIVYDPTQKTIGYVEDIVYLDNEVVAIQNELGTLPKATSASVKERLKGIRSLSDATADVITIKGSNVGIETTVPGEKLDVDGAVRIGGALGSSNTGLTISDESGYKRIQTWDGEPLVINNGGNNVGIGTAIPTAKLDINSDILRLRTAKTPATAGAAGNAGDICWDANFIYICVATNSWTRVAIAAW
ncbi:MAG: hypothetical protein NTZ97_01155 [Candidatus Moranbacteria bacterium]|nr:hypothetical protein [Candidatus Moranbacteria bacterium]